MRVSGAAELDDRRRARARRVLVVRSPRRTGAPSVGTGFARRVRASRTRRRRRVGDGDLRSRGRSRRGHGTAVSGLRIGIDVGGTFTDVVAIDAGTRALKAPSRFRRRTPRPTASPPGSSPVSNGCSQSAGLASEDVAFIAHSTTQATNALLEGDVARVGVIGLLRRNGWLARRHMRFGDVTLAPGSKLDASFRFAAAGDENADSQRGRRRHRRRRRARSPRAKRSASIVRARSRCRRVCPRVAASTRRAATTSARRTACARARERPRSTRRCFRRWCVRRA